MAQGPPRRFEESYLEALFPQEPAKRPVGAVDRAVADVVRAVGERVRPLAAAGVRIGSGAATAPGGAWGAAFGGGGEALAQMIEEGHMDPSKLHKGRIAVEAGLGTVPFGKWFSAGKAGISALKGGALSTAGTVGRKAADAVEQGDTAPLTEWSAWDALPTVLGGGMSAALGKYAKAPQPPAPTSPPKPTTLDDWLRKNQYPEDEIEKAALRAEGLAVADPVHPKAGRENASNLRQAAVRVGKAGEATTKAVVSAGKADIAQEATNLNKRAQYIDKEWQQHAKNANATEKYLKGVAKETDREALQIEADRMKVWTQEAKNENAREAYEQAQRNTAAVEKRLAELQAQGATAETTISQTSKTQTPDSDVTARTVIRAAGEEGGAPPPDGPVYREPRTTNMGPHEAKGQRRMTAARARAVMGYDPEEAVARGALFKDGDGYLNNPRYRPTAHKPASPAAPAPVAPKEGVFQIVTKDGKIIDATDEATAEAFVNTAGPGSVVIPPLGYKPPAKPTKAPPLKGTATDVLAKQEAAAAPPAVGSKEGALKDVTNGTKELEALETQLGREIPPPKGGKGTIPVEQPPAAVEPTTPGAGGVATMEPPPTGAPQIKVVTEKDGTNRIWINGEEWTQRWGPGGPTNAEIQQLHAASRDPEAFVRLQQLKKAQSAQPPAPEVPPVSGVKLSAPLAFKAAQIQGEIPEGSTIARFFRTPEAAMKAGAYTEELPEETIGLMNSLLGRAEVLPKQPRGARKEQPALWDMIGKISKELNLPQFPRGATVKPNFKHVPEGMRPTPAPAAPVIDVATAPPAKPTTKGKAPAKPATPKGAAPPATPVAAAPVAAKPFTTKEGLPGIDSPVVPAAERAVPLKADEPIPSYPGVSVERGQGLPPVEAGKPVSAPLQIRINALEARMKQMQNSKQQDTPEYAKAAQEAMELQQQAFIEQYPELAAELARAEQAAKTAPKEKPALGGKPGKPRLVKPKKGKLGDESGQVQSELLMNVAPALAGAAIGGAVSDEDPFGGAALGGLAGVLGTRALRSLPQATDGADGLSPWDRVKNWQRFSLLSNPENLAINMVAPTTSGALSSIEKMLAGALERTGMSPVTDNLEMGTRGLAASFSPSRLTHLPEDWDEAIRLISDSERADMARGGRTANLFDRVLRLPADLLTTGDIGERSALQGAGWTEDMAREATVTSNPRYGLGKEITNFGKGKIGGFLLPFSRTAANVLEGSLERFPVLGVFMHRFQQDPQLQASVAEIAAQQGIGAAVVASSFYLGSQVDPEEARSMKLPTLVTNLSGQYGALAGAAFAAGQTSQRNDEPGSLIRSGGRSLTGDVPLPTTQVVQDLLNAAAAYSDGEPPNPNAESLPQQWLPNMLTPRFLRDDVIETLPGMQRDSYLDALGM